MIDPLHCLPAKDKFSPQPKYQDYSPEALPTLESVDGAVHIKVIAGETELQGKKAATPIETRFPIMYLDVRLRADASHDIKFPSTFDGFIYCYRGSGSLSGTPVHEVQAALLKKTSQTDDSEETTQEVIRLWSHPRTELRVLVICGQPLREPISQCGAFVMNTGKEIVQTLLDYHNGDFGHIVGSDDDMKLTMEATRKQKASGRWARDAEDLNLL